MVKWSIIILKHRNSVMGTMFSQYSQILALSQLDKVNTGMFYISIEGVPICADHVLAAFLLQLDPNPNP